MDPVSDEQLTEKYRTFEAEGGPLAGRFTVRAVQRVNHKPHPFMVGTTAVGIASRGSGILSKAVCDLAGCDWRAGLNPSSGHGPRCGRTVDEHTSDRVLCLSLVRSLAPLEARDALIALPLTADGLDGVVFIETPEGYRISKYPSEES